MRISADLPRGSADGSGVASPWPSAGYRLWPGRALNIFPIKIGHFACGGWNPCGVDCCPPRDRYLHTRTRTPNSGTLLPLNKGLLHPDLRERVDLRGIETHMWAWVLKAHPPATSQGRRQLAGEPPPHSTAPGLSLVQQASRHEPASERATWGFGS